MCACVRARVRVRACVSVYVHIFVCYLVLQVSVFFVVAALTPYEVAKEKQGVSQRPLRTAPEVSVLHFFPTAGTVVLVFCAPITVPPAVSSQRRMLKRFWNCLCGGTAAIATTAPPELASPRPVVRVKPCHMFLAPIFDNERPSLPRAVRHAQCRRIPSTQLTVRALQLSNALFLFFVVTHNAVPLALAQTDSTISCIFRRTLSRFGLNKGAHFRITTAPFPACGGSSPKITRSDRVPCPRTTPTRTCQS